MSDGYIEFTDDTVFFNGCDEINGCELWKSDGTPEGTVLVKDIFPGGWDSDPKYITEMAMLYILQQIMVQMEMNYGRVMAQKQVHFY
jgi:ELWxxDGT repeat protein